MSKRRENLTEKNSHSIRMARLCPENIKQTYAALDTCARTGAQPWNADVNDYPGYMIESDLESGVAWGLFDSTGLAAYAVLDMKVDDEYSQVDGFDAGIPSATIHRLFTAGRAQGQGLGSKLVCELMQIAKKRGAKRMCIDIYGAAPVLVRFYTSLGFEKIGSFRRTEVDGEFTLYSRKI